MNFRTATGFAEYVEGRLGWPVPSATSLQRRKALMAEAAKIKRKIATDPDLFTWDNLRLAVEYVHSQHLYGRSPVAVFSFVHIAVAEDRKRREPAPTEIALAVQSAIDTEMGEQLAGWEEWVRRLARASGTGRETVHSEWAACRGGS